MSIHVILGPMFAGKTSELLRRGRTSSNVLYLKFQGDGRYQLGRPELVSHDGDRQEAQAVTTLADATVTGYDTVCVDEGQFFPDVAPTADRWAAAGVHVVVSTLVSDYNRKPFPNVVALLAKADMVDFYTATCLKCGSPASFTAFLGKKEKQQSVFCVGGSESYAPVCRRCFIPIIPEGLQPKGGGPGPAGSTCEPRLAGPRPHGVQTACKSSPRG